MSLFQYTNYSVIIFSFCNFNKCTNLYRACKIVNQCCSCALHVLFWVNYLRGYDFSKKQRILILRVGGQQGQKFRNDLKIVKNRSLYLCCGGGVRPILLRVNLRLRGLRTPQTPANECMHMT